MATNCLVLSSVFSLCRIKQEVPSKEVLEQEMMWMKEHLSNLGSLVVLCHNDLLCKNIIHNRKEGRHSLARYATVKLIVGNVVEEHS